VTKATRNGPIYRLSDTADMLGLAVFLAKWVVGRWSEGHPPSQGDLEDLYYELHHAEQAAAKAAQGDRSELDRVLRRLKDEAADRISKAQADAEAFLQAEIAADAKSSDR
jgi:hypothetical protein